MIGGLLAYLVLTQLNLDWRILMVPLFIAVVIYGFMFLKLKFPETERVTSGVSTGEMFKACLNPLFLIMIACMFLTAATELGNNNLDTGTSPRNKCFRIFWSLSSYLE